VLTLVALTAPYGAVAKRWPTALASSGDALPVH
jgi:hypothetical protein